MKSLKDICIDLIIEDGDINFYLLPKDLIHDITEVTLNLYRPTIPDPVITWDESVTEDLKHKIFKGIKRIPNKFKWYVNYQSGILSIATYILDEQFDEKQFCKQIAFSLINKELSIKSVIITHHDYCTCQFFSEELIPQSFTSDGDPSPIESEIVENIVFSCVG